jgi:hypothetical protein
MDDEIKDNECVPDEPAFTMPETEYHHKASGLSKREYFAAQILCGLMAASPVRSTLTATRAAVEIADALINALNRDPK